MDLQYFPMDTQLCYIEIESCKYFFSSSPATLKAASVGERVVIPWELKIYPLADQLWGLLLNFDWLVY